MAKAEMGMRLKVGYAFFFLLFNFFFALNFVQVFESNKTTRHTAKKGYATGCLFLKAGVCLSTPHPPLPFVSLCCGCCACFMPFPSSWAAAAERTQTFPYILIHFYCHAHEHTAPSTAKSNSPRAGGSFSFLFPPRCLARKLKKKEKLFLHNEFLRIFHLYEPVQPLPRLSPFSPAGNRFVVLVACLTVKNFHFPFYFFPLCCSCSKSHRARLTMQIAGKYLGLWLSKLRGEERGRGRGRGTSTSYSISRN